MFLLAIVLLPCLLAGNVFAWCITIEEMRNDISRVLALLGMVGTILALALLLLTVMDLRVTS